MVAPVGNADTVQQTQSALAKTNLMGDFDTFLKMLTTQLQNQDPLSPMDTNQMTDQLTQFGQVEQAINMNSKMESMLAILSAQNSNQSVNLLGRVVEFESSKLSLMTIGTGEDNAPIREAVVSYHLPTVADDVQVQVIDPKTNQVVRTIEGGATIGRNTVAWDGKNDAGAQLQNGIYEFKVVAKDSSGNNINGVKTKFIGLVYSLESTVNGPVLDVGMGLKISPNIIETIHAI